MKIRENIILINELTKLMNIHGIDTATDTPDFILTEFLIRQLISLQDKVKESGSLTTAMIDNMEKEDGPE